MAKHIKTRFDDADGGGQLSGFLDGPRTYLWFGAGDKCQGTLSGGKLLRLAKAIVRHMEGKGR